MGDLGKLRIGVARVAVERKTVAARAFADDEDDEQVVFRVLITVLLRHFFYVCIVVFDVAEGFARALPVVIHIRRREAEHVAHKAAVANASLTSERVTFGINDAARRQQCRRRTHARLHQPPLPRLRTDFRQPQQHGRQPSRRQHKQHRFCRHHFCRQLAFAGERAEQDVFRNQDVVLAFGKHRASRNQQVQRPKCFEHQPSGKRNQPTQRGKHQRGP